MQIKSRNIEPTAMQIQSFQLPPPIDQSISQAPHIEYSDHNKATEPDDDFQNPLIITSRKGKEKVIECSSPIRKK